ncbi:MAG: hypothetical protein U1E76_12255 [Planctomycetota bacterium]
MLDPAVARISRDAPVHGTLDTALASVGADQPWQRRRRWRRHGDRGDRLGHRTAPDLDLQIELELDLRAGVEPGPVRSLGTWHARREHPRRIGGRHCRRQSHAARVAPRARA